MPAGAVMGARQFGKRPSAYRPYIRRYIHVFVLRTRPPTENRQNRSTINEPRNPRRENLVNHVPDHAPSSHAIDPSSIHPAASRADSHRRFRRHEFNGAHESSSRISDNCFAFSATSCCAIAIRVVGETPETRESAMNPSAE